MTWTMTNLVIEIIAGIAGAHIMANAAREYNFGALGRSVVGAIGGCVGGYFFDAAMVVNGSNALYQSRLLDQAMAHNFTAAATGGILRPLASSLAIGFRRKRSCCPRSPIRLVHSPQPRTPTAEYLTATEQATQMMMNINLRSVPVMAANSRPKFCGLSCRHQHSRTRK